MRHRTLRILRTTALILLLGLGPQARAQTNSFSWSLTENNTVPDGEETGWQDTRTLTGLTPGVIDAIRVTLTLSGGFNGDLHATLTHGSDIAILLNRPGKTAGNSIGYADAGMQITFDDADVDARDIHYYRLWTNPNGGTLTGTWQTDGRATDPALVLDTDDRTLFLDEFLGTDPGGDWTLFVADMESGEEAVVTQWGLELVIIPEPAVTPLAIGFLATLAFRRWRLHK